MQSVWALVENRQKDLFDTLSDQYDTTFIVVRHSQFVCLVRDKQNSSYRAVCLSFRGKQTKEL